MKELDSYKQVVNLIENNYNDILYIKIDFDKSEKTYEDKLFIITKDKIYFYEDIINIDKINKLLSFDKFVEYRNTVYNYRIYININNKFELENILLDKFIKIIIKNENNCLQQ